jgi:hypothetical protein
MKKTVLTQLKVQLRIYSTVANRQSPTSPHVNNPANKLSPRCGVRTLHCCKHGVQIVPFGKICSAAQNCILLTCTHLQTADSGREGRAKWSFMDKISIKTPNSKCRLYWSVIDTERYSQSVFSTLL